MQKNAQKYAENMQFAYKNQAETAFKYANCILVENSAYFMHYHNAQKYAECILHKNMQSAKGRIAYFYAG